VSNVGDVALAPATWPRPLLRAIRTFNKYLLNPVMGALAGRKNSYFATIGISAESQANSI